MTRHRAPTLALLSSLALTSAGCNSVEGPAVSQLGRINGMPVGSVAYLAFADEPIACDGRDRVCAQLWAHHANACLLRGDAATALDAAARAERGRDDACAVDGSAKAVERWPADVSAAAADGVQVFSVRAEAMRVHRGLAMDVADADRADAAVLEAATRLRALPGGSERAGLYEADVIAHEVAAGRPLPGGEMPCTALRRAQAMLPLTSSDATVAERARARAATVTVAAHRLSGCQL